MIEKTMIIVIFMYCLSISFLAMQYSVADIFNITLTNYKGEAIDSAILNTIKSDRFNTISTDILDTNFQGNVTGTPFNRVIDFNVGMAYIVWEFVLLLSGTYFFYILYLLGLPLPFVSGLVAIYFIFLARTIVGILRGF